MSRNAPGPSSGCGAPSPARRRTADCPRPVRPTRGSPCTSPEWARGDDLADVLADDELTGGDFVRNVKQCVDLLRQIADVAPDPATRRLARVAADTCVRGVVAAASALAT